jgi:hypothetical protein
MPLPLIVPVVIGIAGVFGAGAAAVGASDMSDAKKIASNADSIKRDSENQLENEKKKTNELLEQYGSKKIQAFENNIQSFLLLFNQIKNVQFDSTDLEHRSIDDIKLMVEELTHSCNTLAGIATGLASGATGGALAAFGAYSGTMLLASAGTGTAISSLSGVAATNATLAWLGGGTLASGGLGVAGGTMVLGALVAGPALLIFGSVFMAKASKALDDANSNMEKAKTYQMEVEGVCQKLRMIQKATCLASDILSKLRTRTRKANTRMSEIIESSGSDYQAYSEHERRDILKAVKYTQLLKSVMDTAIIDENGALANEVDSKLTAIHTSLT